MGFSLLSVFCFNLEGSKGMECGVIVDVEHGCGAWEPGYEFIICLQVKLPGLEQVSSPL